MAAIQLVSASSVWVVISAANGFAAQFDERDLSKDWRKAHADYDAMRESTFVRRRQGLAPGGGAADYHVRNERQYLNFIEKSRDMRRNDNIVGATIDKAATNCVQSGFLLRPMTGDDGADKELAARWKDWSEDADQCDIQGESTWHEMELLAVTSMLGDGDVLGIGTQDGPLQMIESHLCRNPYAYRKNNLNVVLGVEIDQHRKAQRYHIRQESANPHKTPQNESSTAYDVRDDQGRRQVFHFQVKDRVSATRGVTCLAPVFQIAGMFEDLNFAKVVQAQVVSCFALMRYRKSQSAIPSVSKNDYSDQQSTDVSGRLTDELKPGMEVEARIGETIEGFSPNVPNPEYFEHAKLLLMLIGINIGVPYVEMMLDATATNFSGWRGAVDTARRNWMKTQTALRERWHEPTYKWKVGQWQSEDAALRTIADRQGVDIFRHVWQPPAWPYIQPKEDAFAQLLRMTNGLASPRRIHAEQSMVFDHEMRDTVDDLTSWFRYAAEKADELNQEFPNLHVDPRELMRVAMPQGMQIALNSSTDSRPQGEGTSDAN